MVAFQHVEDIVQCQRLWSVFHLGQIGLTRLRRLLGLRQGAMLVLGVTICLMVSLTLQARHDLVEITPR